MGKKAGEREHGWKQDFSRYDLCYRFDSGAIEIL